MPVIFNYFWIALIVAAFVNAHIMRYRSKEYVEQNHELKAGYDKLFKGMILYPNIPWVIMGAGILLGQTNGILHYFNPRSMNPFVLIFHFSIIVLWILSVYWIYFNKGAEFIEKHPGIFQFHTFGKRKNPTAKQIKWFFPLALIGGIIGMIFMWTITFPDPLFH